MNVAVWVHTWKARDGLIGRTLESLDASDAKGLWTVERQPDDCKNRIDFLLSTWEKYAARDDLDYIIRVEDDVLVNKHIVHNATTWEAVHDEPLFGMGLLSVADGIMHDRQRLRQGVTGAIYRATADIHFSGANLFRMDTLRKILPIMHTVRKQWEGSNDFVMSAATFEAGLLTFLHEPSLAMSGILPSSIGSDESVGTSEYFDVEFCR